MPTQFMEKMYAGLNEMRNDPELAFQIMIDAGVYTKEGNLTEHYQQ